jgi:hypothetical protein
MKHQVRLGYDKSQSQMYLIPDIFLSSGRYITLLGSRPELFGRAFEFLTTCGYPLEDFVSAYPLQHLCCQGL